MKKNIIAVLVATIILFVWQSLSWMALGLHDDMSKYNPQDKEVMTMISSKITEDGVYMMPGYDPSKKYTMQEHEAMMKENIGKPYALLFYHKAFPGMDPMMMVRGFLLNMIAVLMAVFLVNVAARSGAGFGAKYMVVMALPVFCIFQAPLLNWNWWQFPWQFIKGEIMDQVAGWALAGLFLARYLGPKKA